MTDDTDIKRLPVRFKQPGAEDRTLLHVHEGGKLACRHYPGHFIVDETSDTVECGTCHERLNPMWVLKQLTNRDSTFHQAHTRYADEMKRLEARSKTKCRCCGKMTEISRS